MRRQAFTLIELLVVIAIIGLLLSILIPSLAAIKEYASITNCLANQRSLCIAFKMYADENHDKFCSGYVFQDVAKRNPESWVKAPLAYDAAGNQIYMGDNAGLILEHRLNGIREGAIYPYLENTDMFHCPGDRRLRKGTSQKSGTVITRYQAYRSYGMPDFYGVHGSVNGVPNETNLSNIKGGGARYCLWKISMICTTTSTHGHISLACRYFGTRWGITTTRVARLVSWTVMRRITNGGTSGR